MQKPSDPALMPLWEEVITGKLEEQLNSGWITQKVFDLAKRMLTACVLDEFDNGRRLKAIYLELFSVEDASVLRADEALNRACFED